MKKSEVTIEYMEKSDFRDGRKILSVYKLILL
jgi:hypothetical protein